MINMLSHFLCGCQYSIVCMTGIFTSISHEGELIDGPDDLLHVVLVVWARDQLLQRVQLCRVHLGGMSSDFFVQ